MSKIDRPEHIVIVDSIGGANVLTCEALGIKSIECPYRDLTVENVKKTILDYKYMKEEDANFDLRIQDARPEPENYNEQKDRESKEFKAKRDNLFKVAKE